MSVLDKKDIQEREDGVFVEHQPCLSCTSSDGMAVYQKADGFHDGFCWVCESYFPSSKLGIDKEDRKLNTVVEMDNEFSNEEVDNDSLSEIASYAVAGSRKRGIRKQFMDMYGIKMSFKENGAIESHYYPLTKKRKVVGYKKRKLPKTFSVIGDGKNTEMFGQSVFEDGEIQVANKFVCLCEGELDTVALQQVLWEKGNANYRNAVVGIPSGSSSAVKSVQNNWKWLNKFEQIVLFFDQDEPGKKAALEVAKKLPLGKVKIAKFSEKDPCDMLANGKQDELYNAFWKAETYAPDGVLAGTGLWNLVSTPIAESAARYPWKGLDDMLHGIRGSELVTLTAGTGLAKSTFARLIAHHLQKTTDENVGMIFLEESVKKTAQQMMSLELGSQLHLGAEVDEVSMKEAFDKTLGTGQYYFFDEFASQDFDSICESILYMARAANCKYIFLDHISMLVSGGEYGDERRALDAICTKLRTMVQQLDITLFAITHLKRPQGQTSHEEGGQTSLAQLRGSAGIAQLSDIVIGFERNSQSEDPFERNTTHIRVLKNRFSGECSLACSLYYDNVTGSVKELTEEEIEDMDTESSEFSDLEGFSN